MSYARSPRPVCSTTNGTEAILWILSGSDARVIGTPGLQLVIGMRSGGPSCRSCRFRHRFILHLRCPDHEVEGFPLEDGLRQCFPPLRRGVMLPDARGV